MGQVLIHNSARTEADELTRLLFGSSRAELRELWSEPTNEQAINRLTELLGDAIHGAADEPRFRAAISPVIANGVLDTARRQPKQIGDALAPALGPGIRAMIKMALDNMNQRVEAGIRQTFTPTGLKWRMESWRTGVALSEIVLRETLSYRVEHLMVIHRTSGTLLRDLMQPDYLGKDPAVMASMLSAISQFIGEAFTDTESTDARQFTAGSMTVRVFASGELVLAAVIRGEPPNALSEMFQRCLETLAVVTGDAIADFSGDLKPFEQLDPFLTEYLVSRNTQRSEKTMPNATAGRSWLLPLLVVLLVSIGTWHGVQRAQAAQWTEFVNMLQQQPGLVLLESRRLNLLGQAEYEVSGLIDRHAKHPAILAQRAQHKVRWHLRSYLSADLQILQRRVREILQPAKSTQLRVEGSTLQIAGRASAQWLRAARLVAIPGISEIDTSRVFVE